jgi:hypothetical protein
MENWICGLIKHLQIVIKAMPTHSLRTWHTSGIRIANSYSVKTFGISTMARFWKGFKYAILVERFEATHMEPSGVDVPNSYQIF